MTTALAAAALAPGQARAEVVRYALVIGVNDGGDELEPLRYAESDAERMAEVLTDLGGFDSGKVLLLKSPSRKDIENALKYVPVRSDDEREDMFLFYYSGHADAVGLKLGTETYPFEELKEDFRAVDADVRLGILDACRSGAITRVKGATVVDPFLADRLDAEGEAWITASSADERAQESDALAGSFFTYYLVSGLRGAAAGDDTVVSLNEAYAYAYDRTVARTGGTSGGPQHPEYEFKLAGKGDLELTVLDRATARLTLPADTQGRIMILTEPEGTYVAELVKIAGNPMTVALKPGVYRLRRRDGEKIYEVLISLSEGSHHSAVRWGEGAVEVAGWKGGGATEVQALNTPDTPDEAEEVSPAAAAGQAVVDTATVLKDRSKDLADRSKRLTEDVDWRQSPAVASGLSAVMPGTGQFYNHQWLKGVGMMGGSIALLGTGFALFNSDESGLMTGSVIGPNPLTAMGWMAYGLSVSDAGLHHRASPAWHPERGWTLAAETAWSQTAATPYTAGMAADFFLLPQLSVGLDRTGLTRAHPEHGDGATFSFGGRAMVGPDWKRYRPALFVATGFRAGNLSLDSDVVQSDTPLRFAVGAGVNNRLYLNHRYFVQYEFRTELDGGDLAFVHAAGLGWHFGTPRDREL
ncbi:MAG: caspase family protein [Alphaproteobacteria bacterium]|nr:caspase family protein [Alphaproteobacteria bacterium]